jgi:hypothetical protein
MQRRVRIAIALVAAGPLLVSAGPAPAGAAGARAAAVPMATVIARAKARYADEANGPVVHAQLRRIARDQALLAALRSGSATALRSAALHELFLPHKHVVRLRVVRAGRTLVDVGGRFVARGPQTVLRAGGRDLGTLQISIQDMIGYVKLIHRHAGGEAVVRGQAGHQETSLPAAPPASLPGMGAVAVRGHRYTVGSFRETGFGGEPMRVWIFAG